MISWRAPLGATSHRRRRKFVSSWSISANRCAAPAPMSSVDSSNGSVLQPIGRR
ncbi:hypothetical protein BJ981_000862 [Sphaerisporangium krabiense]|uniref:Uncharacterized protein n=1 Tax=Sphaerisporangium krabiense TaxID=763782 RepID=A0A7W9DNB2_9ACTN|nr:hypothetical protein [Sphaerisporangium krabiense]